jgi:hypothetical protein
MSVASAVAPGHRRTEVEAKRPGEGVEPRFEERPIEPIARREFRANDRIHPRIGVERSSRRRAHQREGRGVNDDHRRNDEREAAQREGRHGTSRRETAPRIAAANATPAATMSVGERRPGHLSRSVSNC